MQRLPARTRTPRAQVTSTRKGLRNQLKSLLWRKAGSSSFLSSTPAATDSPAGTAPSTPTAAGAAAAGAGTPLPGAYLHSSVEGEMRALSDLAMLLRDYDTALSTLRLLASDFKQDKAWKHYAAVQVCAAGSLFALVGWPRECGTRGPARQLGWGAGTRTGAFGVLPLVLRSWHN